MRLIPKVTTDLNEYAKLTKRNDIWEFIGTDTTGLYMNNVIWVESLNPKSLFHEMGHHLLSGQKIYNSASLTLFRDIFHTLWDIFCFRITHLKIYTTQKIMVQQRLKQSINDWLDWVLCR